MVKVSCSDRAREREHVTLPTWLPDWDSEVCRQGRGQRYMRVAGIVRGSVSLFSNLRGCPRYVPARPHTYPIGLSAATPPAHLLHCTVRGRFLCRILKGR